MVDLFGHFLDHVVPTEPPLILTSDQLVTASQQYPQRLDQCIQGAAQGIGEELAWSVLLVSVGQLDMMIVAYIKDPKSLA